MHRSTSHVFICLVHIELEADSDQVDFVLSPSAAYNVDVVHSRSAEIMAANKFVTSSSAVQCIGPLTFCSSAVSVAFSSRWSPL